MPEFTLMGKDTHKEKNTSESESDQEVNQRFLSKVSRRGYLIENNEKHLERNLLAAQRDQSFLKKLIVIENSARH